MKLTNEKLAELQGLTALIRDGWGQAWLDADDDGCECEVCNAAREIVRYCDTVSDLIDEFKEARETLRDVIYEPTLFGAHAVARAALGEEAKRTPSEEPGAQL